MNEWVPLCRLMGSDTLVIHTTVSTQDFSPHPPDRMGGSGWSERERTCIIMKFLYRSHAYDVYKWVPRMKCRVWERTDSGSRVLFLRSRKPGSPTKIEDIRWRVRGLAFLPPLTSLGKIFIKSPTHARIGHGVEWRPKKKKKYEHKILIFSSDQLLNI